MSPWNAMLSLLHHFLGTENGQQHRNHSKNLAKLDLSLALYVFQSVSVGQGMSFVVHIQLQPFFL